MVLKKYEGCTNTSLIDNNKINLLDINRVIKMYPVLSKHILTNAINDGSINVTWIGNKRYFKEEDIEEFIERKKEQSNNVISKTIANWRNNE